MTTAKHQAKVLDPATSPVHSAPYRVGFKTREFERIEINTMLIENIIKHAQTKRASAIVLAHKQGRTFSILCRTTKNKRRDETRILPDILHGKMHQRLRQCTVFSTLDANSGYWQIEISETHCNENVYTSCHRQYRFIWMSIGLQNKPVTFQHAKCILLSADE